MFFRQRMAVVFVFAVDVLLSPWAVHIGGGVTPLLHWEGYGEGVTPAGTRVILDLSGLEYISSAGLRVLLIVAKKVQQAQGKVALCGLTPNVREIFAISGFDAIFSIQPDAAAAIAAVR